MVSLERKVERAARKGAAFSAAAILAAVGLAFLTAASWLVLSELRSATFAATIIGIFYLGISAIALAIGLKKSDQPHRPTPPEQAISDLSPLQMIILGFVQGFEKGRQRNQKD